jgi:PKD repeat protein
MLHLPRLFSIAFLTAAAVAQSTVVIPNGAGTAEGNGANAFPWGRGGNGIRCQNLYDSVNFTNQGVSTPVVISRLRWRPNTGASSLATSYATGGTVKLSTSPLDQAAISTTLTNNQGSDLTTVFSGPVSWPAAAATTGPCPFLIDVPLATSFYYDPSRGDLNVETDLPIQSFTGTQIQLDHHANATTAPASRAIVTTGYSNAGPNETGVVGLNTGAVVELTYTAATGIHPRFVANNTHGQTPFSVTFTSQAFTDAPGGITGWAWDFDGDSVIDSTQQNPTFVYTGCGDFPVTLTCTDGVNPPASWTAPAYIKTDEIVADFSYSFLQAPSVWQFTDTSTPGGITSWAWDFDGDNVTDSTLQHPIWLIPSCVSVNVRLTVTRGCRTATTIKTFLASPANLPTVATGTGTMLSGQGFFFDLNVTNPQGISICSLLQRVTSAPSPFSCFLYVTPGTWVGNDSNAARWRLVGTATANPSPLPLATPFAVPVYLPMGSYGIALYYSASTFPTYQSNPPVTTFSNADVTFTNGTVRSTLFGGSVVANRLWVGTIHYDTAQLGATSGFGFYGPGCAGTSGISNLVTSTRPRLGTTMSVNCNNLPQSMAVMMMGFSNTNSVFGPLPVDLTAYGAPGCFGRMSPDATQFLFGAANAAMWQLVIPLDPNLAGLQFYNQALVLDPPANGLGAVTSDAACMLIGF